LGAGPNVQEVLKVEATVQVIGLTGGIASGKSTAGRMLAAAGVPVIDADVLAREAVAAGSPGLRAVVERFGATVLDAAGALDRQRLGAIVFGDDDARRALNAIVHPEVARLAAERFATLRSSGQHAWCVYEVPLLFENGLEAAMAATILVAVPDAVQLARVRQRDGLAEDAARARIRAQMPQDEKRRRATVVVENDADLPTLAARLSAAWERVTGEQRTLGG
jgi:dephospho-CoA kinase